MSSLVSSITTALNVEVAAKKGPAAQAQKNGHKFTSNVFAGVAVVSVIAAAVAAAIIFVPAVAAIAAPVTGFFASKFGATFAAYNIPAWAVPASFGAVAAISAAIAKVARSA